jgi:hypothetical protein
VEKINENISIRFFIDKHKNFLNFFQEMLYGSIKKFKALDLTYLISNNRMLDGMELVYLALIKNEDFSQSLYIDMIKILEECCTGAGSNFLDYEILVKPTLIKDHVIVIIHKKEKYWDEMVVDLYTEILFNYGIIKSPRYRKELNEPYILNGFCFTSNKLFDIDEMTIDDIMKKLFNNWSRSLIVSYLKYKYKYNFLDAIKVIYFIINKFVVDVSL